MATLALDELPLRTELQTISATRSGQVRIPELDGLRGIAILSVIGFHYFDAITAQGGGLSRYLHPIVAGGWMGVDLFFVLSGFLIGGILLDAKSSPSYFKTFYIRRAYRILPVYYVWVCGYFLVVAFAGTKLGSYGLSTPAGRPSLYTYLLFLQNLRVVHYSGMAEAWLRVTWSLAVEEQFYLISPLLVRLLSRRALIGVLGSVVIAAPLLRLLIQIGWRSGPELASMLMPCRADSFAMGILAAVLWRNVDFRTKLTANASIAYIVCVVGIELLITRGLFDDNSVGMQVVGFSVAGFFFAAIILFVLFKPASFVARATRMGWLRNVGSVSYCMYLIHPVIWGICFYLLVPRSVHNSASWKNAGVSLLALVITLVMAKISWHCLEKPLLRRGSAYKY